MRIHSGRVFGLLALLLSLGFLPAARAADEDPVKDAIQKGVKFLQGIHQQGPRYNGGSHNMGSATLAGMALLESGVPPTDPSITAISTFVRNNALGETRTYEVSLAIMFLDRLGNPSDRPIIQLLGVRLMGGQGANGGYSYDCGYALSADDEARLKKLFTNETRLVSVPPKSELPKTGPNRKEPAKVEARPDIPFDETFPPVKDLKAPANGRRNEPAEPQANPDKPVVHPEVIRFAKLININNGIGENAGRGKGGGGGDNSNTQFATLGLWCARKHGVPCEKSLGLLEERFRTSQNDEGGWGYTYRYRGDGGATPAMTCAGLIALAVSHGTQQNVLRNHADFPAPKNGNNGPVAVEDDQAIKKGLKLLGQFITAAKGEPVDLPVRPARKGRGRIDSLNSNYYFLWSMERVAVIYGLDTIGKNDWYTWGGEALLTAQNNNGSWSGGGYPGANDEINTCFALLFLNKANVAKDLAAALKGKIKDPGVAILRGGSDPTQPVPPALPKKKDVVPEPVAAVTLPVEAKKTNPNYKPAIDDEFENEAARLSSSVLKSGPDERSKLLAQLRDNKGAVHSEALARIAAQATGELQVDAREAFARRLTRMTAATLREMLKDPNREVRRAAALACGYKDDKQFIADLLAELSDRDLLVVQASRSSLQLLTNKDFGPEFAANEAGKAKAIQAWQAWWKMQMK